MSQTRYQAERNSEKAVSVTLSKQWAGSVLLLLFFLAALTLSSRSHAAMSPANALRNNAEISLRASGIYGEMFEMAMEAYREKNFSAAIKLWEPIAKSGYAAAQYNLGVAHARGLIGQKDMIQAGRWWYAAAQQGNPDAQYNLGLLYATGNGVEMDMAKAVHWWQQAALIGDPAAQFNLGMMYARGDGVTKNMDAAIHWWTRSAAQKFPQAKDLLNDLVVR